VAITSTQNKPQRKDTLQKSGLTLPGHVQTLPADHTEKICVNLRDLRATFLQNHTGTTTSAEAVVSILQPVSDVWSPHFGIHVRTSPALREGARLSP